MIFSVHLLAGEDCGDAPLPNHTSSILTNTLLMKPALEITLSLERLVMVDSGCGRETVARNKQVFKLRLNQNWPDMLLNDN